MNRQQNAKARGEAAIGRILRSKSSEHKERAFECDVLGDLVYVRISELLDHCSTSTSNQNVVECNNLMSTMYTLNIQSDQHLISSQKILLEAKERQINEELRQHQVHMAVLDFNTSGQLSDERNCISGVNKLFRTAIGNRFKYNAQVLEE